jgi:hypothetical protein
MARHDGISDVTTFSRVSIRKDELHLPALTLTSAQVLYAAVITLLRIWVFWYDVRVGGKFTVYKSSAPSTKRTCDNAVTITQKTEQIFAMFLISLFLYIRIAVCAPNEWNVQKSFTLNYGNRTGTVVVKTFSPPPPTSLLSPPSPQPPDFTANPFGLGTVNLTSVAPGDCFTLPSVNDTVVVQGLGEGLNTSAW